jgi:hypothetical protein
MLDRLPRLDGGDMANHLFYGSNLLILRDQVVNESVDLIYFSIWSFSIARAAGFTSPPTSARAARDRRRQFHALSSKVR